MTHLVQNNNHSLIPKKCSEVVNRRTDNTKEKDKEKKPNKKQTNKKSKTTNKQKKKSTKNGPLNNA